MTEVIDATSTDVTQMAGTELWLKASAEDKAAKAAKKAGEPIPATPHLDELRRRKETGEGDPPKANARPVRVKCRLYHDGHPMPDSQNSLSSVAYYYTKAIDGDAPRVSTDRLIALLAEKGVADPRGSSWDVKLPNGITLSSRVDGDTKAVKVIDRPKAAPVKKTTAKKAAPAKAAAKKTTSRARRSTPAKKAPATKKSGRDVTPRLKETARKAS